VEGEKVGLAALVPEHSFAVDPWGVVGEHSEGRFDFGTGV
jgi:hypothetical protein